MSSFPLKIVTPFGPVYDGMAEEVIVRTTTGDLGILAGHVNCVAPLGMGRATIMIDGQKRYGACIGGMISMMNGSVSLVPSSFEWAEDIDVDRAEASHRRAEEVLNRKNSSDLELKLAKTRLNRALVRKGVASLK